jgi:hypothetical protein
MLFKIVAFQMFKEVSNYEHKAISQVKPTKSIFPVLEKVCSPTLKESNPRLFNIVGLTSIVTDGGTSKVQMSIPEGGHFTNAVFAKFQPFVAVVN